jgi:hypothetical protein
MYRVVVAALGVILIASSAHAEPDFPAAIQTAAGIPCAPPCTLCHTTSPGTLATATKAFAGALLGAGLVPRQPDTMAVAIANLRTMMTDTDHDGVSDVEELKLGTDPSDPRQGAELCGPIYGCAGGHIAKVPPRPADRAPWLFALALALLLLTRMRRARTARDSG